MGLRAVAAVAAIAGFAGGTLAAALVGTVEGMLRQRAGRSRRAPRFVAFKQRAPSAAEPHPESLLNGLDADSRGVITLARQEAIQNGHGHIGTEHLAMALRLSTAPVLRAIWEQLEVDPDTMRRRIDAAVPPDLGGGAMPTQLRSTPRLSRIFAIARKISSERERQAVTPLILLVALADEGEGVGAQVLASFGATAARIREIVDTMQP